MTGQRTAGNIGPEDPSAMSIPALTLPTVLLVDDDRELTTMLAEYLGREGFRLNRFTTSPQPWCRRRPRRRT